MENVFLEERSARDIDAQVSKVLRDLGSPEPPLRLELVRESLELDKAYYSSGDHGVLKETVHRLRVGVRQIIKRPTLLLDVVRRRELKALWVPDRKRILIDSELKPAKQRWAEGHEIGHSIIPWHGEVMHGDQLRTLNALRLATAFANDLPLVTADSRPAQSAKLRGIKCRLMGWLTARPPTTKRAPRGIPTRDNW